MAVPRIDSAFVSLIAIVAVYALVLNSFVAVPARILGAAKQRLKPKEATEAGQLAARCA